MTELRCCLLYGLYLGLLGFPATLSLCLLLEMCCKTKQNGNDQKAAPFFFYSSITTFNVILRLPRSDLFQLDLRVHVDVTDLAVEGFVLQAGALQPTGAAVLQLGSRSGIGLDGPGATPSLQHCLVL